MGGMRRTLQEGFAPVALTPVCLAAIFVRPPPPPMSASVLCPWYRYVPVCACNRIRNTTRYGLNSFTYLGAKL